MARRPSIIIAAAVVLAIGAVWWLSPAPPPETASESAPSGEPPELTHGPLTGGITTESARLWLRTSAPADVAFVFGLDPELESGRVSDGGRCESGRDCTVTIDIDNLLPDRLYYYRPVIDGIRLDGGPCPRFRTAPPPGSATDFRFVYLTDFQNPRRRGNTATFGSAALEEPAFTVIGGDFDHRNPGRLDGATISDQRQQLEIMRAMRRDNFDRERPRRRQLVEEVLWRGGIAHFWDDHDFCCNDSDGTFIGKRTALRVYDEYFPGYRRPHPGDGIFQTWTWGEAQFFLLDGRFNRTPSDEPDDGTKTMLGEVQKHWLQEQLAASTARWKILLSGSVFNPTVKCGADNWCDYRTEARQLCDFVRREAITNVVVLSGDIHAGGITDGRNSVFDSFWEMAVPGADTEQPGCDTTSYQGPDRFGEWTHGTWGVGYRVERPPRHCFGYGLVEVFSDPPRLVLSVRNEVGETMISATVTPEEDGGS